jgi:O-antigen/teichoic acid export membrane protein
LRKLAIARYAREFGWVAAGNLATMLATLVTLKYLTSILAPNQFGELNLILTAIILPSWLIYAPISQAALRWYAQEQEARQLERLVRVTLTGYVIAASIVVGIAGVGDLLGASGWLGVTRTSWWLAAALLVCESFVLMANGFANAARHRKRVAAVAAAMLWLRLFIAIAGGMLAPNSPELILASYVVGTSLVIVPAWVPFSKLLAIRTLSSGDWALMRRMLAYGLPFGVWSSFAWAQQYVDRYAVDAFVGRGAAGVYIAATQLAAIPFAAVGTVVSQFLTPIVFEIAGEGNNPDRMQRAGGHVLRIALGLGFAGIFIVLAYFLFGDKLVALLATPIYQIPNAWIAVLAAGALLQGLAQQLTVLLLAGHRSELLLATRIFVAIAGIPITWFLTSAWGMFGAVLGYVANAAIFLLAMGFVIVPLMKLGSRQ